MRLGLTEMQVVYLEEIIDQLKGDGFGTTPGEWAAPGRGLLRCVQ